MSCDCENMRKSSELERIRSLARKAAQLNGCIYVIVKRPDGTYCFNAIETASGGKIVEYIHYY